MQWVCITGVLFITMACCRSTGALWEEAEIKADFCLDTVRGKECFKLYHFPTGITWTGAAEFCRDRGGALASILDCQVQTNIVASFSSFSNNPDYRPFAWIGGKEQDDDAWRWLDGSNVKASLLQSSDYRTCAFLAVGVNGPKLQSLECNSLAKDEFICAEITTDCEGAVHVVHVDNDRYCSYRKNGVSWYGASNLCQTYGGTLASFPSLTDDTGTDATNLTLLKTIGAWVGLRRRRWKWEFLRELITDDGDPGEKQTRRQTRLKRRHVPNSRREMNRLQSTIPTRITVRRTAIIPRPCTQDL